MSELTSEEMMTESTSVKRRGNRAFRRMYRGGTSFDFVGRKRLWFAVSTVIIVLGIVAISVRGLNLGIDFKGDDIWVATAKGLSHGIRQQ